MAIDVIQQIAQARANMMMRDYLPLRVTVGRAMWQNIRRDHPELHLEAPSPEIFGMPVTVRDDMEGFIVQPG